MAYGRDVKCSGLLVVRYKTFLIYLGGYNNAFNVLLHRSMGLGPIPFSMFFCL